MTGPVRRSSAVLAAAALALAAAGHARAEISYTVAFEGVPDDLESELERISGLASSARPAPTLTALAVLARRDIKPLVAAMQAAGFYAAQVDYRITNDPAPKVVFEIEPGPTFRIVAHEVRYEDEAADRPTDFAAAGIETTNGADGASLERLQTKFAEALRNSGFPSAQSRGRTAVADFENGTARAVFRFESGPRARFGAIAIDGAKRTDADFIRDLASWEDGALYERNALVAYRDRLMASGVFSSVDVEPGSPDADGSAPVLVTIEERKRRTIGAGLAYSTSEGPGGRLFFEYRNLFGAAELARAEIVGSGVEQRLTLDLNKPLPTFPGGAFGQLAFENETTDAFDARTLRLGSGLSRRWLDDRLETRAAIAVETSKVKSDAVEERSYLVSTPLSATWNTEDDLLAPTRGLRASLVVTPYAGSANFMASELNARTRILFGQDDRFTAAFRARVASIFGSALAEVPLNRRLYAGGGASVRGYGFQEAGPLDADGAPTGGRSAIEAAAEARARLFENWQIAAFVDAGTVSSGAYPDFSEEIFVGVGAGVRYATPIGPIRLDVATPLNRRESDRAFQIYISLGQPF